MFEDRLLSSKDWTKDGIPFITIAIPHYKHRHYLEIVLQSLFDQTYDNFEIVVSNDCSPDDSDEMIPPFLERSGRFFRYYSQPTNLGYDGNVRFCLTAARGKYVFLLGNDDALAHPQVLHELDQVLQQLAFPEIAVTNFQDWLSGEVNQRALDNQIMGSGVETALKFYRSFSFVSGLIFDRLQAEKHVTDRWDRSIYYQIYLACRIMSAGGRMGTIDITAVRKDIRIAGEHVPNYETKWSSAPISFEERHTGIDSVLRVAWDGMKPYLPVQKHSLYQRRLLANAYLTLHPYWVLEYRRVANWSFAFGVARGHNPVKIFKDYTLNRLDQIYLWLIYLPVTAIALLLPVGFFNRIKGQIGHLLRSRNQRAIRDK